MLINSDTESSIDPFTGRRVPHEIVKQLLECNALEEIDEEISHSNKSQKDFHRPEEIIDEVENHTLVNIGDSTISRNNNNRNDIAETFGSLPGVGKINAHTSFDLKNDKIGQAFHACESALSAGGLSFSLFDAEKQEFSFTKLNEAMLQFQMEINKNADYAKRLEKENETKNTLNLGLSENVKNLTKQLETITKKYKKLKRKNSAKSEKVEQQLKEIEKNQTKCDSIALIDLAELLNVNDDNLHGEDLIYQCKERVKVTLKAHCQEVDELNSILTKRKIENEESQRTLSDVISKYEETKRNLAKCEYEYNCYKQKCEILISANDKANLDLDKLQFTITNLENKLKEQMQEDLEGKIHQIMKMFSAKSVDSLMEILKKVEQVIRSLPKLENFIKEVYILIEDDSEERKQHVSYEMAVKTLEQYILDAKEYFILKEKLESLLTFKIDGSEDIIRRISTLIGKIK